MLRPLTLTSVDDHIRLWGAVGDAHVKGIGDMVDFFIANCIDPTHVMLIEKPFGHDDDLDHFFLIAGHLKRNPQQMLYAAFFFYSYI